MERQISARRLKEEVDVALWELQITNEPESVVLRLLYRLRYIADGTKS